MYTEYIMKTWNTIYTHLMISRHLQITFLFIRCLLPVCRTLLPSIPTGVTRVPRTDTRGIWKVMHTHLYNFTQCSEKKDEGISVNVRIWGFWGYLVLMFALMR